MGRGEAGGKAALPIWIDYMATALKDIPQDTQSTPEFIQEQFISRSTGKATFEGDPSAIKEYFAVNLHNTFDEKIVLDDSPLNENGQPLSTSTNTNTNPSSDFIPENNGNFANPDRIIEVPEDTQGLF